jgi:putative spermidine/putrescine transport system permease protein
MERARSPAFYWLALLFGLFVLFLYGPMFTILILAFQGPEGGLTFPLNGVSLHWFAKLWEGSASSTFGRRSVARCAWGWS